MNLEELELEVIRTIHPPNMVKMFKSMDEFKVWCHKGTIKELEHCIELYGDHDLWEHCKVMQDVIKEKIMQQNG